MCQEWAVKFRSFFFHYSHLFFAWEPSELDDGQWMTPKDVLEMYLDCVLNGAFQQANKWFEHGEARFPHIPWSEIRVSPNHFANYWNGDTTGATPDTLIPRCIREKGGE